MGAQEKKEDRDLKSMLPLAAVVIIVIVASLLFLNRRSTNRNAKPAAQNNGASTYEVNNYNVNNGTMMEDDGSMMEQ